jgi:hypothetical protein
MMKLRLLWKYRGGRMDKAMQEFADRLIEKHGTG